MNRNDAFKEGLIFAALTWGASFLVFWGPLALFKVPAISFVSQKMGPWWAIALFILGGFVPSLVGVFLTWRYEGAAGLRRMGRRVIQFNIGWRWYLAALAIVVLVTLGQIVMIQLLGRSFDLSLFVKQLGSLLPLIILGPLSEELGWRGFLLDRLQTRWNPVVSGVVLGGIWGVWHLPLFLMPGTSQHELSIPFLPFLFTLVALSVLFAWLHNNTAGSIWTALFFHWIYTYASQVISTGAAETPVYHWLLFIPYLIVAMLVIAIWRPWAQTAARQAHA